MDKQIEEYTQSAQEKYFGHLFVSSQCHSSFISLDNDDYWDEEDECYDTQNMLKNLEQELKDCLVIDAYACEDIKNNVNKYERIKRLRNKYNELLQIKEQRKSEFVIWFAHSSYWRVGIDGFACDDVNEIEEEIQDDKVEDYITFYLLVTPLSHNE